MLGRVGLTGALDPSTVTVWSVNRRFKTIVKGNRDIKNKRRYAMVVIQFENWNSKKILLKRNKHRILQKLREKI